MFIPLTPAYIPSLLRLFCFLRSIVEIPIFFVMFVSFFLVFWFGQYPHGGLVDYLGNEAMKFSMAVGLRTWQCN